MTRITQRTLDALGDPGGTMATALEPTLGTIIAELGRRRTYAPGEALFLEGDDSHSVVACLEGRIRIVRVLPSGRELLLGIKVAGDVFGELSALDGQPRAADAVAIDHCVAAHLPSDRFLDVLASKPELAVAVFQSLAAQLRRANDRLCSRNSDSALVRTGHLLVELTMLKIRHGPTTDAVELPLTQSDLANWIGSTRESTARALARFRRVGLVETKRGKIIVRDVVGLTELLADA